MNRLNEIDVEEEPQPVPTGVSPIPAARQEELKRSVLEYLNSRGYTMASFERLAQKIEPEPTIEMLRGLIAAYPTTFRSAKLKENRAGIAKRVP